MSYLKARDFFKGIINAALGIYAEILLTITVVFAGFLICLLWWGIFR